MIRVSSATFLETLVARYARMSAWVSCAYQQFGGQFQLNDKLTRKC